MFCQSLAHEKSRDTLNPADTTILEAQSDRIYMTHGLLSSWSAFFLIKKGKKDIFIPFIRPPCNIYSSPPPKKPYPSPVLTALALNTEAQSIDILLIIIVTPRQWDSFPECETEMCLSDLLILTGTTNSQIKCFNLPSLQCLTVFYGST